MISNKKWGWFTLLFLLLLVVCGWWIAHYAPASLKAPWIVVMLVLIALCVLAGHLVNNRIDGILIDDRNRISLSRLQWVMWLIILLGAYFTEAVWNLTHAAAHGFPTMDSRLYLLLGIVSGTAVASNLIVENKKDPKNAPPTVTGPDPHQGASDVNASPADASWADLYTGDEVATRYVVDISRLQKLVITVLLGIAYVSWLCNDLTTPKADGLDMPGLSDSFVWLLGLSNGAYIAAKAPGKTPVPTSTAG